MCENSICDLQQVKHWRLTHNPQNPTLKKFNFKVINLKNRIHV